MKRDKCWSRSRVFCSREPTSRELQNFEKSLKDIYFFFFSKSRFPLVFWTFLSRKKVNESFGFQNSVEKLFTTPSFLLSKPKRNDYFLQANKVEGGKLASSHCFSFYFYFRSPTLTKKNNFPTLFGRAKSLCKLTNFVFRFSLRVFSPDPKSSR